MLGSTASTGFLTGMMALGWQAVAVFGGVLLLVLLLRRILHHA